MNTLGYKAGVTALGFAGLVLASLVGCGSGAESYVKGRVTLDGEPLDHGQLVFVPTGGGATSGAAGAIDGSGYYKVQTGRSGGLNAGTYSVAVTSREAAIGSGAGPPAPGKLITPKKYSDPSTSGLEFEVKRGSNTIDLELTSS